MDPGVSQLLDIDDSKLGCSLDACVGCWTSTSFDAILSQSRWDVFEIGFQDNFERLFDLPRGSVVSIIYVNLF